MDFLEIDGSFGEGGGQIVRTAVTLSCILKRPIKIKNIRKGRSNPGLKPQHLTILKILKKICDANLDNVKIGSTDLQFIPNEMKSFDLTVDVGTAGSVSLISQVLIPLVAISKKNLKLKIKGGTNVSWSPTIDYTKVILKELYARMGIEFSLNISKRGYYPRGGGVIELEIFPTNKINPLNLKNKKTKNVEIFCSFSKIPLDLINEQIRKIKEKLIENNFEVHSQIRREEALDAGGSLLISSIDNDSIIGVDSLFNKKTKQFDIILEEFIQNNSSVDTNLADMLVLPACLANGMTVFRVKKISKHLETNLVVASKITGCKYGIGKLKDQFEIRIEGISYTCV
jgi:RNA 3'-terminal phosphate cyclase (ATP)